MVPRRWQIFLMAVFISQTALALQWRRPSSPMEEEEEDLFHKRCNAALQRYQNVNAIEKDDNPLLIFSLDEVVRKTKEQNFEIKLNAERVFQARENIKVSIGRLLPRLNFGAIAASHNAGIAGEFFEIAASLLGFLYPSNWFRWRESKLFFEAERRSFAALIANQVNIVTSLFYEVSYIKNLQLTYLEINSQIEQLWETSRLRFEAGEDRIDRVIKLENILELLRQDLRKINNELQKIYYSLAYAINEPVELWNNYDLALTKLPDLSTKKPYDSHPFVDKIFERSYELAEMEYLILASKYSTKSRYFDFLNPIGDDNASLGFGYISHIRIGKSHTRQLLIKKDQLKLRLSLSAYEAVKDANYAISSYKEIAKGLARARQWLQFTYLKFEEGGEYDVQDFVESIESILSYQSRLLSLQYKFLISKAVIDRLLLRGPHYQNLLDYAPKKVKRKSLRKKYENHKIKKAIRLGELKTPDSL